MAMSGLLISVVLSSALLDGLRLIGAGYFHCFIANHDVGDYIIPEGQEKFDGWILDMYLTFALILRHDKEKDWYELIPTPLTFFVNQRVKNIAELRESGENPLPLLTQEEMEQEVRDKVVPLNMAQKVTFSNGGTVINFSVPQAKKQQQQQIRQRISPTHDI
jgi:hypothetical protein